MKRPGFWPICLTIWAFACVPLASAATITVDSTADDLDLGPNGNCTLREAIQAANTDAPVDHCAAGAGADTIEIPAGTYTLAIAGVQEDANATGDLDITSDVTLTGAGADLSILDGGATAGSFAIDRLLDVHGPVTVELRDLALQNGAAGWIGSSPPTGEGGGSGLRNDGGAVTLRRVSVRNDACRGYWWFFSTEYAGPGGGIESKAGTLVVEDSWIEHNSAALGGGIAVSGGSAMVRGSVVRDNLGWYRGGGIEVSEGAEATIERSAVIQNSAVTPEGCVAGMCWPSLGHGFGLDSSGAVTLVSSTVADNGSLAFSYDPQIGAAIENAGVLTVESSTLVLSTVSNPVSQGWWMLSDRTTAASTGVARLRNSIVDGRCSGPNLESEGGNLSSDATCGFAAATDLESTNPRFAGLVQDPTGTWVVTLEPLSPAIDSGDDANCPATDQRGAARPIDGNGDGVARCDRGAYETDYQPNGGCTMDPGPAAASAADGARPSAVRPSSEVAGLVLDLAGIALALGAARRLRARRLAVWPVGLMIWAVAGVPLASAATITVDSTADDLNLGPNGNCTLREAIQAANTESAVDGCAAGAGADTIVIPAGTYTLTIAGRNETANQTGDLDLASDLTLAGAGSAQTILEPGRSSNPFQTDRVLHVAAGHVVEIRDLTLRNGQPWVTTDPAAPMPGGAIFNEGSDLTILSSVLRANHTGGTGSGGGVFHGGGVLRIEDSELSENFGANVGGAVYLASGSATIRRTVIRENAARDGGGGVFVGPGASVDLEAVAIVGNAATSFVVPGYSDGWDVPGGGLWNQGTAAIVNSTFSGNSAWMIPPIEAGGREIANDGVLTVADSTIAQNPLEQTPNTWNFVNHGQASIRNTILASGCVGTVVSFGYNLSADPDCSFGDVTDRVVADLLLGALVQEAGGTWVVPLEPLSPAIDSGDDANCPATDQRGATRPIDGNGDGVARCDRGAYETDYQPNGGCSMDLGPTAAAASSGVPRSSGAGPAGLAWAVVTLALIRWRRRVRSSETVDSDSGSGHERSE